MSDIETTSGTLFGTKVNFLPLPTPYPSLAGCGEGGIHRQVNAGTMLGWDPVYTRFDPGADSCFPPQQRPWWNQDQASNSGPSTALGPTFVCPEAYSGVHSTVLESNSASQAQYTYCCPKKYTLGAILPQNQRSVIQCSSIADPGVTIAYVSVTFLTSSATATGEDGADTVVDTTVLTHVSTSTVVQDDAATVYAPPINGYNIVRAQATSSETESAATEASSTAPPTGTTTGSGEAAQSSGLAPGAIAGIAVGVVLGVGLLALAAFFLWRRHRRQHLAVAPSDPDMYHEQPKGYHGVPPYVPALSEMPEGHGAHEMDPQSPYAYELPSAR
ncbi:uncharacterized protein B0H64DRAFT_78368 [Chaetomium fimeti]|uniref:Uncharacterized protein n=1 Tax=Chaetomium fimeti TaxID=1854472 RepID=A0AAE0LV19_9PEZI|nr:hypothetical protein B0H64DRAFT_78368 [Chaetomium fimeti]